MSRVASALAVIVLFVSGCSSEARLIDVEGIVTMNGQPMSKIEVEFWPVADGPRSVGLTDEQGKFTLTTDDKKRKGALPGKHKVLLRDYTVLAGKLLGRAADDVDMTEGRKPRISEAYLDPLKSPLSAEVTDDKKLIELEAEPYTGS